MCLTEVIVGAVELDRFTLRGVLIPHQPQPAHHFMYMFIELSTL